MSMNAVRSHDTSGWVPEFEFEVWSLGIDCMKFQADSCRDLANLAAKSDAEQLTARAVKIETEIKALSSRINAVIDNMLGDFYSNGGQALAGNLVDATKEAVRRYLDEIEAYEVKTADLINNTKVESALEFILEQEKFYREKYLQIAEIYPEGEVKTALLHLAN